MSIPNFDPWIDENRPPGRAYRAYCAYIRPNLGTLGTIGTGADSNSSVSHPELVRNWERKLWDARLKIRDSCGSSSYERMLISAIEFCRGPWAARLTALGWGEQDLFAISEGEDQRGGLIQSIDGNPIRLATDDRIYFGTARLVFAYVRLRSELVASRKIWDLPLHR